MDPNLISTQLPNNVNQQKNLNMNKSAILFNKLEISMNQNLPKYVSNSHKTSSGQIQTSKTRNLNKSIRSSQAKNKTILQILQKSAKEVALSIQDDEEYHNFINLEIQKKKFPKEIINIFYRQNVNGYNPYLVALKKLDQINNISHQIRQSIRNLCYIGIAKNQLKMGGLAKLNKYSRVGILIRPYMNYVMAVKMQEMKEFQPQTIYIKVNSTALSFNPKKVPHQIQDQISKRRYSQIIKGVNSIIESEYKKHKMSNSTNLKNATTLSEIIMYVLLAFLIISMVIVNPQTGSIIQYAYLAALFAVILIGTAMAWKECNSNLGNMCSSKNLINNITLSMKHYLQSVSNDFLVWKPGPDFYWLQVHNIKVKKRKYQQNNDDF